MRDKSKGLIIPLMAAIMGGSSLIGLYLSVLSVAKSPTEAITLFGQNKLMLLVIALGFALQLGMYVFLRKGYSHSVSIPGGKATTAAGGGTSSVAMLACCAPTLVNALPLLGFTALTTLLAKWQMPFIAASILANVVGITLMGVTVWKTWKAHRHPRSYLIAFGDKPTMEANNGKDMK